MWRIEGQPLVLQRSSCLYGISLFTSPLMLVRNQLCGFCMKNWGGKVEDIFAVYRRVLKNQ